MIYAYGAPQSLDDLPDYFLHLFEGKQVPDSLVGEVGRKFRKFGTVDPLGSNSYRIAKGLEETLSESIEDVRVYNAYKHTAPFIEDTLEQMLDDGVTTVATLAIYPIFSPLEAETFHQKIEKYLEKAKQIKLVHIVNWHKDPEILSVYEDRVIRAYKWLPSSIRSDSYVLYTVHSQRRNPIVNKQYVQHFEEMASRISQRAGIAKWKTVYRSAGKTGEWLMPDVKDEMKILVSRGVKGFVTCELMTLVADIESYYEIGEDCQLVAEELKTEFVRAEFPGDSYDTIIALAAIIEKRVSM